MLNDLESTFVGYDNFRFNEQNLEVRQKNKLYFTVRVPISTLGKQKSFQ